MRAKHRMSPPRDGASAHVPVGEGVGGGVVLPRQAMRSERYAGAASLSSTGGAGAWRCGRRIQIAIARAEPAIIASDAHWA
jgi:hypothetical protein